MLTLHLTQNPLKGLLYISVFLRAKPGVEKSLEIMAERKSSTSLHSKGGAGEFTRQVQRKFSRAQEKVRVTLFNYQ